MTLDPAVQMLLTMMEQMPKIDYATATPADARAIFDNPIPFGEPVADGGKVRYQPDVPKYSGNSEVSADREHVPQQRGTKVHPKWAAAIGVR